jgi:hypothetical protein
MSKPDPEPLTRIGFCAGCQRFDVRLTRVAPSRYRCDECAVKAGK